ncbi:MAG: hypothetical protein ABIP94_25400 [Planctomycetota bacterium]
MALKPAAMLRPLRPRAAVDGAAVTWDPMRMHIAHGLAFWFVALVLLGQDFVDLPWRQSETGRLEVRKLANAAGAREPQFGEWVPMFPGSFVRGENGVDAGEDELAAWGPFILLPLLVHGDGGAAALDESSRRLRKLSLGQTVLPDALLQLRPDALVDLLRVRHLATSDLAVTFDALRSYATVGRRDAFVRAAAAQAYAEHAVPLGWAASDEVDRQRAKRNGAAALQSALARMPDDVDLVLGVHGAAMPGAAAALAAWRTCMLGYLSTVALASGGSMSPAQYCVGQLALDRPGQLPYELATRFGNWRVDHALIALRHGERDQWWFQLGGVFQPARIVQGLREVGGEVWSSEGGEVRGKLGDWQVRATATELEAWPVAMEIASRGAKLATLHDRAAPGQPPAWLLVPAKSRLGALLDAVGCSLDVRLQLSPRTLTATAVCAAPDAAQGLLASWQAWQQARRCDPNDKPSGEEHITWRDIAEAPIGCLENQVTRLAWRRCVQAVRATGEDARVTWLLDLAPFSLVDLVRLFRCSPVVILRDA